jgi:hemolysin activation/secretion protein
MDWFHTAAMRCGAFAALLLAASAVNAQNPAPRAETLRFDILEFVVAGNTVLPVDAIERAVYPFLGPGKTVDDAENARKALERAYQDAGYLSVTVELPPQRVDSGELRLVVQEAPVARLRITGAQWYLPSQIAAQVPSLAVGSVPNFNDMQAELGTVARQTADREVTPVIAAGEQPGTMSVELQVQDKAPFNGFVELNSKQTQNSERGRLEASASWDNLFQRRHSIGAYWYYAPSRPADANVLALIYRLPFGDAQDAGDSLALNLTRSDSDTPTALGGSTVSRGTTVGLRWRDELRPAGAFTHALNWSITYRHLQDRSVSVAGFSSDAPPLRYPSFGVGYELQRSGPLAGRQSSLQAGIVFGLAPLGKREVDCDGRVVQQFACKRSGAKPAFQVVNLSATHREPFGAQWAAHVRAQAQFSSGPLVPAEQITLGGVDSVRGYYEGEQAGDFALVLRAELDTPRLFEAGGAAVRALAFYDRAALLRKEPLPGEIGRTQMGSVGFGLRLDTRAGLQARLDWAHILFDTRRVDSTRAIVPVSGTSAGRDQRWELSVRQSF